ncbi:ATP-binding protein [Xanthomonas sp. 3075]|uniref:ATP-binding protein n=1 Tax=Xanthomonas sp. 3075 TaxID=3035315 RepID=UPI001616865B|nr:ATP-binding protein [Xanthomonas sp. 3075]MBB4133369.1 putative ATPase [Xanthomonas sp. 3075]
MIDLDSRTAARETVSILVGPNGSGKSSFLRDLAVRRGRNILIVCNTPHDRFTGLSGLRRMSVGNPRSSPTVVVKNAVAQSLKDSGSTFYQISSILEYCGYRPRFGFRINRGKRYGMPAGQGGGNWPDPYQDSDVESSVLSIASDAVEQADLELAATFMRRHDPSEYIWIDATEKAFDFSRAREFAPILKLESKLRASKVVRSIQVFLQRDNDGDVIEIQHASSGQLALISSLLFMITNAGEHPVIIIDEPENSLHPKWQREYVDKVLAALSYRNPTIILATHAPLVVTGALADSPDLVSVFEVRDGAPQRLPINLANTSPNSIEEILWRAFGVVTPANHFVSEQIVDEFSRFEKGEVPKEDVLALIRRLERGSYDSRQRDFFAAARALLDKVDANQAGNLS